MKFDDVAEGVWYWRRRDVGRQERWTAGMTLTTFVPDGSCTRAQMVEFL